MSYEKLYDAKTLFHYLLECRKGVHWKHSVQAYSLYAVANIARLAKMMRSEEWAFAPCRHFTIRERGKERDTEAASMDERVVQKALRSEINQSFATWFLAKVDRWCKEIFKLRHYARYMDDIYIIHPSKLYLTECLEKINFMLTTLNLQANKQKTRIIPLERGFTFFKVHYTLSESGKIKKRYGRESGKRIRRKLRKFTEKRVSPVTVRNEYQSWRKAMKKFDADGVIKASDAVYRKYTFGGRDGMD